jgi:trimeric autotransporter adhesin
MVDDDGLGLGVNFAIHTGASEEELLRLQATMNSTEGKLVAQAAAIERATSGMVKLPGATAAITAAGNASTKELQALRKETAAAERGGDSMVKQLQRQVETFGKTAAEIRNLRAEQRALAAESSGLTELAGRIRGLNDEMVRLEAVQPGLKAGIGATGATGKLAGHHMQNLAFQFQDLGIQMVGAANSSAPLKMGLIALLQQGTQIQGVMSQAGVGVRAVGAAFVDMSKTILVAAATNPYLLAIGATIGLFAGAVSLLNKAANESDAVENYAKSLGLTADQIEELGGATVTWGDTAKAVFQVAGAAIWDNIGPAVMTVWDTMKSWTSWIFSGVKAAVNFIIGGFVGGYNLITKIWRSFPAVLGDLFYSAVNAGIGAINGLIQASVNGINGFIATANSLLSLAGIELPTLTAPQIKAFTNTYAGAMAEAGKAGQAEMSKSMGTDWVGRAGAAIEAQAIKNRKNELHQGAKDKGFLDDKGNKGANDNSAATDKHAEALQREADAVEASIKNLYLLADAYNVSGAAALLAEARLKAESDAIKDRANFEQRYGEQVRLSIAQRVSDAAKATASVREQADAQAKANEMVAQGLIPADKASEYAKDLLADLPLIAALQVAGQTGLAASAEKATDALIKQQAERERLRKIEEEAAFAKDIAAGENQLAVLREELRLVGATNAERLIALATLRATQEAEAKFTDPAKREQYIAQQLDIANVTHEVALQQRILNDELSFTADKWDLIAGNVQNAASGIADAFGKAGAALGDLASIFVSYHGDRMRLDAEYKAQQKELHGNEDALKRAAQLFALKTANIQIGAYGDMAAAAKGFFNEKSKGYKAIMAAEKVFRAFEFAMSVRSMAQDLVETVSSVANSGARAVAAGTEGVAAQSKLPFPLNIAAMAATGAALLAAGIAVLSGGGGGNNLPASNSGTGTVLGDGSAQSESIKNAISALKDVDVLMLNTSRQMAASLRTIEDNIAGFASLLVRQGGDINASGGVVEGFKASGIGKALGAIPLIGGVLKSLFGTKTTIVGSGLFGGPQSLGSVLAGGFDASYYSDIQKKKKLFGITTGTRYTTQFTGADATLENQFTLILRSFNSAILAAAGPLGASTSEIEQRLNGFIVDIGKIDLKGLTGEQIEEKLNAVFGAAADDMARTAFPLIEQYQRVGEGAFETLTRVVATVEAVGASFDILGQNAQNLDIAAKLGLADQFESISALTGAVDAYFQTYYTKEEQSAARMAQLTGVFASLDLAMPSTLAAFRQMVEAQDLTTAAGRETYAVLLQLAPAFADLQAAMDGAKSAADIASERADLQRQLLELQGDTAALRALQLAKLDASNRALQLQIWAIQDAQAAAKAADELRKAWTSVGDSIMDEVRRIRGLTDVSGGNSFALLQGQFNAATALAQGGDQDAAKRLPQLSQALLTAAAEAATSRQELDRVRAQTAASLEATFSVISGFASIIPPVTNAALLNSLGSDNVGGSANDNSADALAARFEELRDELAQLRAESTAALSAISANTGSMKRTLDDVTSQSGGDAIATVAAA